MQIWFCWWIFHQQEKFRPKSSADKQKKLLQYATFVHDFSLSSKKPKNMLLLLLGLE